MMKEKRKLPVVVWLVALAMCFTAQCLSAQDFSQTKVSLNKVNATLFDVLTEIKNQTGVNFVAGSEALNAAARVNAVYTNAPLQTVLDGLMINQNLTWKFNEDYIVISRKISSSSQTAALPNGRFVVRGRVADAQTGLPIPGASVWVKDTSIGTATNGNGEYSLTVTGQGRTIEAEFLGYTRVQIPLDRETIDFMLSPLAQGIEEVQVVAFGIQKKESVIGAISSVNPGILVQPTAKISSSLAGHLSGVVAVQRSGEPGSGADFWIRGMSTFGSGKSPLVIVDGIERALDYVDPEDVESFSILKDATATAVYGVKGANGVFLVTTKRGKDSRPRIRMQAETALVAPTQMPEMVNAVQFAELYNEALGRDYYTDEAKQKYRDGSDPDLYPNVNWIDQMYKKMARSNRVNASVTGGGSIARYYVSGSFYNEGSILKEDPGQSYESSINYNKFSFRSNVDINISPSTELAVSLANIYETKRAPGTNSDDMSINPASVIWEYTFSSSPNAFPVRFSDGRLSEPNDTGFNPWNLMTQTGYRQTFYNTAQAVLGLTQDFSGFLTEGLKANVKFSWDASNTNQISRRGVGEYYYATGRNNDGSLNLTRKNPDASTTLGYSSVTSGQRVFYLEGSLSWNRTFNDTHRLGALFLYNQKTLNLVTSSQLQSIPFLSQGIAGRLTYDYKNRYFAEANFGYNGSENFAPGNRFGFFPAGAVGWLVSEENFWSSIKPVVDMFKIRASYGLVGNDQISNDRFSYMETISSVSGHEGYTFGETNDASGTGRRWGRYAKPNISWETSRKFDLGVEISLLHKGRLMLDYFVDRRGGIFLTRQSIPGVAGYSTMPLSNVGKAVNRGFEAELDWNQRINNDWTVTARGTFTYNRSQVVNNDQPDYLWAYQSRKGKPIDQQFGLIADGLFSSQEEIDGWATQTFGPVRVGDIKYVDVNSDGVIDAYDEVAIGRTLTPEIVYGFGASVRWKNLDVSFHFQGVGNTTFFMGGYSVRAFSANNLRRSNMYEAVYDKHWSEKNPDPDAMFPRLSISTNANNYRNSTYWQYSNSFIRLKNAEIGYTLPRSVTSKIKMDNVRVYVSGVNLLTFSDWKLWDPEMSSGEGRGYPPQRIINFGLTLNL